MIWFDSQRWNYFNPVWVNGPVHKGTNHIPKAVSEHDSDPFLIWKPDFTLKLWMQSSFKSGFWNAKRRAFWIVIRLERLILPFVNAKLIRNMIRACAF